MRKKRFGHNHKKDIEGENLETVLATVADWCKVMKHEIISAEQKGE